MDIGRLSDVQGGEAGAGWGGGRPISDGLHTRNIPQFTITAFDAPTMPWEIQIFQTH